MCEVSAYECRSLSKLDLCEGGSFSPTIFNSDIELSVFPISCFMSECPLVALSKATYVAKIRTLFGLVDIKKRSLFNLLCVLICYARRIALSSSFQKVWIRPVTHQILPSWLRDNHEFPKEMLTVLLPSKGTATSEAFAYRRKLMMESVSVWSNWERILGYSTAYTQLIHQFSPVIVLHRTSGGRLPVR